MKTGADDLADVATAADARPPPAVRIAHASSGTLLGLAACRGRDEGRHTRMWSLYCNAFAFRPQLPVLGLNQQPSSCALTWPAATDPMNRQAYQDPN